MTHRGSSLNTAKEGMTRETPGVANRRWYEIEKSAGSWYNGKSQAKRQLLQEFMQLRGDTVISTSLIPPEFKKRMLNAIKKGYTSCKKGIWPSVLDLIAGKTQAYPIGFIGRTEFSLWLPATMVNADLINAWNALLSLDQELTGNMITRRDDRRIHDGSVVTEVRFHVDRNNYTSTRRERERDSSDFCVSQLRAHFTTLRKLVDMKLKETMPLRRQLFDYIQGDNKLIIPFSTRKLDL
jgi:hypothetical protein